jgi:hypothetical protein
MRLANPKMLYSLVGISVVVIGFGVYRSWETAAKPQAPADVQAAAAQPGSLASFKPFVDLGTVSMAAGKVPFRYMIKNSGGDTVTINRVYTSCMCTEAMLVTAKERSGPFGMPGHGLPRAVKAPLAPGESASVEVLFDPAAHGPSGLGRVDRVVTLESREAPPLELRMTVMVKP